jgi:hypothetical protein
MVMNRKLEKPFNKVPPEANHLETLQPTEVKAKLSAKVTQLLKKRERSLEERSLQPDLKNQTTPLCETKIKKQVRIADQSFSQ